MVKGILVLEDGSVIEGEGFGAQRDAKGEVVFTTAMFGYQEYLTDPSYKYQIPLPTYPLIGNYGIGAKEHYESEKIHAEGLVVRELCEKPSHGQMVKTLDKWLKEEGVPGLQGIDTRMLTRKIRNFGSMRGILKLPYDARELEDIKREVRGMKDISEMDLIDSVTIKKPVVHEPEQVNATVVILDCGVKLSMVRCLMERGCKVVRVPARTDAKDIIKYAPDGLLISNGPGDPGRAKDIIKNVRDVIDKQVPTFGICFGNQLVGLALGGRTYKLKFGHRGGNQPVKDLKTGRVYITSQNHGFAVDAGSLEGTDTEVTHINLNDRSVEGIAHKSLPVRSVQYHPEARPGPWDNDYLFEEFIELMGKHSNNETK
jgi:carbamoyl-phosphate synthase small subunit